MPRLMECDDPDFSMYLEEYYESIFLGEAIGSYDWSEEEKYFRVPPSLTEDFMQWRDTEGFFGKATEAG